jgi:D-amino-acid dehydrogenase
VNSLTKQQGGRKEDRRAVVIGAGIVGMCCALYLQRDGWQVAILDAVPPISKPGLLWRVPVMLLDPRRPFSLRWSYLPRATPWLWRFIKSGAPDRVERITAELASLARQVEGAYAPLLKSAGAEALIHRRGMLLVCETEAELRRACTDRELRERHGAKAEAVGPNEIRQIEPALAPIFKGGTYRPDVWSVASPVELTRTFARDFAAKGGVILKDEAIDVATGGGRPHRVTTRGRDLVAERVVLAAGAWSRRLVRQLGAKLPLDTERGYHVMLADPGLDFRLPVGTEELGFYCTPMADGLRVAGTVEIAGLEAPPNFARADVLLRHAKRFYPGLRTQRAERWMGFRPSLPDSKPVISGITGQPGIFLAFGHGHIGLTLAAVTGRAIADMAAGRQTVADMTPFRVDRF